MCPGVKTNASFFSFFPRLFFVPETIDVASRFAISTADRSNVETKGFRAADSRAAGVRQLSTVSLLARNAGFSPQGTESGNVGRRNLETTLCTARINSGGLSVTRSRDVCWENGKNIFDAWLGMQVVDGNGPRTACSSPSDHVRTLVKLLRGSLVPYRCSVVGTTPHVQ